MSREGLSLRGNIVQRLRDGIVLELPGERFGTYENISGEFWRRRDLSHRDTKILLRYINFELTIWGVTLSSLTRQQESRRCNKPDAKHMRHSEVAPELLH